MIKLLISLIYYFPLSLQSITRISSFLLQKPRIPWPNFFQLAPFFSLSLFETTYYF